jgi:hypothetical protein
LDDRTVRYHADRHAIVIGKRVFVDDSAVREVSEQFFVDTESGLFPIAEFSARCRRRSIQVKQTRRHEYADAQQIEAK